MTDIQIYNKLHFLNPSLKKEVSDFIDRLLNKQKSNNKIKKPKFGCAKGRFKMSPDFDEPLEDFKEYMS
jgi:predicted CopG family antitoxin